MSACILYETKDFHIKVYKIESIYSLFPDIKYHGRGYREIRYFFVKFLLKYEKYVNRSVRVIFRYQHQHSILQKLEYFLFVALTTGRNPVFFLEGNGWLWTGEIFKKFPRNKHPRNINISWMFFFDKLSGFPLNLSWVWFKSD